MNQRLLKIIGWGALALMLLSIVAFFVGKYRTSFYSFEFGVSAFLVFFFLSLFLFFSKSASKLIGFFLLISLSVVSLFGMNFLEGMNKEKKKNYREWILKAKEKGKVLELPYTRKLKEPDPAYSDLLIQNHLDETIQGYSVKEILPQFNHLDGAFFQQLDFLGIRYLVYHLRKGKEKTSVSINDLPITATFNKQLIFKVPRRRPKVVVLYGSEFSDVLRLDFGKGAKWFAQDRGTLYLQNQEYKDWNISLELTLVSKEPVEVELKHQDRLIWSGVVQGGEERLSFPKLSLVPGKNVLSFEVNSLNKEEEPIELLLSDKGKGGIGIKDLEVINLGLSPKEVSKEKEWESNLALNQWLKRLPAKETFLEYPLAHRDWATPIRYEEGKGRRNFYYDQWMPKFAARFLGNKPTPSLALWMEFLGIDYLVLHTQLYDWSPILTSENGFEEVQQLGEARIYRPVVRRIYFESEEAKRQIGKNIVDAAARKGMARFIEAKSDQEKEAYLVFGPHAPLLPGKYRVTYTLKSEKTENLALVKIDVSSKQGEQILKEKVLSGDDFKASEKYQDFVLEFEIDHFETVEFRVLHQEPTNSLWSDTILLEKI